jgi:hypothetical protein
MGGPNAAEHEQYLALSPPTDLVAISFGINDVNFACTDNHHCPPHGENRDA